jgi:hypothetical protein
MLGEVVLRLFLVAAGVMVSASSAAAIDERSALWLSELQRVEEMMSASISVADFVELKKQTYAAHRLTGRAPGEVLQSARLDCVSASSALANVAMDLQSGTPASALVNARADAEIYRSHMAACERRIGIKGKRLLRF